MLVVKSLLDCARLCAIIVNCTSFNCRTQRCALSDIFKHDRALEKNLSCFTKSTEGKYYVWLSGAKIDKHWVWSESIQQFTYTNWGTDQPDNIGRYHKDADCLALRTQTFQWEDLAYDCGNDGGKAFNGWCYRFVHPTEKWEKAKAYCEERHMQLLEVKSEKVQHFIAYFLQYLNRQCRFGGSYFLGNCYVFFHDLGTAAAAKTACHSRQMTLYEDTTMEKSAFIAQFLKPRSNGLVWMAGSDKEIEGRWVWSESRLPVSYTRWGVGQPDNGKRTSRAENCLAWDTGTSTWNDHDCQKEAGYLCEYRWNGSTFAESAPGGNVSLTGENVTVVDATTAILQWPGPDGMRLYWFFGTRDGEYGPDHKVKKVCEENNMKLVEIMSAEDQQFLEYYIKYIRPAGYECVWMGLSDAVLEGHWVWQASNEIPVYKNWAQGQPDCLDTFLTYGEDCAAMDHHDNKWHDKGCTSTVCDYVCEFKMDTYVNAETACHTHDMRVYEDTSKDATDFLELFLSTRTNNSVWLAGSDRDIEKNWRWLESKQPFTYENWADGEPDDDGGYVWSQDCLVSNGKWSDTTSTKSLEASAIFKGKQDELLKNVKAQTKDDTGIKITAFMHSATCGYRSPIGGEERHKRKAVGRKPQPMMDNLVLFRLDETDDDDTDCNMEAFMTSHLKIEKPINFERVHRIGNSSPRGDTLDQLWHIPSEQGQIYHQSKDRYTIRKAAFTNRKSVKQEICLYWRPPQRMNIVENVICLWIGLSEIQEEGVWRWKSSGKTVDYTHWNEGQPSGKPHFYSSDPDCVYIKLDSNNTWHDGVCSNECPFICEQRMNLHD
ncbi:macrophage mannose receptor 1-like [Haliotis asinina]|uniref:macrophage mannose receptor 1-like n=1 Tax=Haliotis asinina TaxID=109174 RepID=UPI003531E0B9